MANNNLKYYPMHITHMVVSFIWMIGLVAINAIEFYFDNHIEGLDLFWIVMQNAVIGSANAYWLVRTHISPTEMDLTTSGGGNNSQQ